MSSVREKFGQRQPVSVAIRKLIRDYPCDVGILKELIQNADDGGAREILLILDPRDRGEVNAPLPGMRMLGGPAIIAANDKTFSPEDLENIQRLADSEKIEAAGKTGRFGLGFNSVYNLTDFPLLLTGNDLCLFDPCATIVGRGDSGEKWRLDDEVVKENSQFLDLFIPGCFSGKEPHHEGTIFRLPLRSQNHVEQTRGAISSVVFGPEIFDILVSGLLDIADSVMLFLKNLEFIGCYRVDPKTSKRIPLLEIETLNPEDVRVGREKVNDVLIGTVEQALDEISSAPEGRITTSFLHEIKVTEGQSLSGRSVKWRVITGLYAGKDGRLVDQARALRLHHEKAIPSAGVAVCLERGGIRLPSIDGQVCCFLPLGAKHGTFPVQLHGSFDIDSGRSDITSHTAGEDLHKRARGLWNDLLIEDGVAEAYCQALEFVKEHDLDQEAENGEAEALYLKFPSPVGVITGPLAKLSPSVYSKIAPLPFFRCVDGVWYPAANLVPLPENQPHLLACLVAEKFLIPQPIIPDFVIDGLGGDAPANLDSSDIRDHFHTDHDIGLPLAEVPYPGLRIRSQVEAVITFLLDDPTFNDWKGLPLALCADGKLHTLGFGDPVVRFIGTARQRDIFATFSDWFLDEKLASAVALSLRPGTGAMRMTGVHIAQLVPRVTGSTTDNDAVWDLSGPKPPNRQWITNVLAELNAVSTDEKPESDIIDKMQLIPGDDGRLHHPGAYQTPLLVKSPQKALCRILKEVGVLHFLLSDDALSKNLERFASNYERVWYLTPKDLADSLTSEIEELAEKQEAWARTEVVEPLLCFLSSTEALDTIAQDADLLAKLRQLPLFEDQTRTFAGISNSCFLPGAFSSPEVKLPVRLLRESGWRGLIELLGVAELNRRTLLCDYVLKSYETRESNEQLLLLRWIRDEWNSILNDCSEVECKQLLALLGKTPLVRTTNGLLSSISEVYDPACQELVKTVIGEGAAFPDLEFYADQKDIWVGFFRGFQLAKMPRPQDLADIILRLSVTALNRSLTAIEARQVELFLAHVTEHWNSLREEIVDDSDSNEVTFAEFLSDLAWCPVVRDLDRLQLFGSPVAPEDRLYQPSMVFLAEQGNLVASQAPLLKQGRRAPSAEMREELGFREQPDPALVVAHLQILLKPYGARELNEVEHKRVSTPARVILEYFGRLDFDEADTAASAHEAFYTIREIACVYHPERHRFYKPCDLFRSAPVCLAPWKINYVPGGKSRAWLADALDRLGRRAYPGIEDYIEVLSSIATRAGNGVKLEEGDAKQFLAIQAAMTLLISGETVLNSCPVLDRFGYVARSQDVLHLDDAWLEKSMVPALHLRFLHRNTPELLIERLNIARVSQLLQKIVDCALEDSQAAAFRNECSRLEVVLTNDEFLDGFRRLANHQYGFAGATIELPEIIELKPVVKLRCANQVEFGGQVFDLAKTDEDFCVSLNDRDSCVVCLAESASDDLPDQLALALNELLASDEQIDKGDLAAILRWPTAEISSRLDRRRIPQIAQGEFDSGTAADPAHEIEFDESSGDGDEETDLLEETNLKTRSEDLTDGPVAGGNDRSQETKGPEEESDESSEDEQHPQNGRARESGQNEVRKQTAASSGGGGGERRGRMLPGTGNGSTGKLQPHNTPKRQDDLWISRPKNEKQVEQRRNGDASDDEVPINHRVGNAAVGWVLQYERSQGRRPQNMAHANAGYDVESRRGRIVERYIEVKGINGEWGNNGVPLSSIQFEEGWERGDEFWLYVVENALDSKLVRIHAIQNPVEKITQFRFDRGWSECGEPVEFHPLEPKVGMKLFKDDDGEGEIVHANHSGSTLHLKVLFDGGDSSKNLVYDPRYMQLLAANGLD
ncbi:MAG: hypothetical protein JWL59_4823 [Chthoniobacteraceae bacterium]|nr:hypothetical protein [Chthoniobacteraceae bacterium]